MGFEPPSWQAILMGRTLLTGNLRTWNQALCDAVGSMRHAPELRGVTGGNFSHTQGGGGAGAVLSVAPTSRETLSPHLFRVILLRRLRQALPLCARWC